MTGRPMLHVCCNDPDNGLFNGRAVGLTIGRSELEAQDWEDGVRFAELPDSIRIAGKVWPTCGAAEWVGNWCWNAYTISDGRKTPRWWLVDVIKWVRRRDLFTITASPVDLYDWFNHERLLSDAELHREICDALDER